MKITKKILIVLFVLLVNNFFVSNVNADIIPSGAHPVERCVKIINLSEFPEVYVISNISAGSMMGGSGPMLSSNDEASSIVKENQCLTKGYKFNGLSIYLADKNYIDSIGIENFNPATTSQKNSFYLLSKEIEPYGGYLSDSNPLKIENIEYSLIKLEGEKFALQKTKIQRVQGGPSIDFLIAMFFTILLEIPILLLFFRKNSTFIKILVVGFLANVFSLFCLWYVLVIFIPASNYVLIGEACVIIIEAIIYTIFFKINVFKAILVSIIANVFSWAIGILLSYFGINDLVKSLIYGQPVEKIKRFI